MIIFALLIAVGLKLSGMADVSWVTLVLIFAVWIQRGKDFTDIDNTFVRNHALYKKIGDDDDMLALKEDIDDIREALDDKQDKAPKYENWND